MTGKSIQQIVTYLRAACPCIVIQSHEETRVLADLAEAVAAAGWKLATWSVTQGVIKHTSADVAEAIGDTADPAAMLAAFGTLDAKTVLVARDFHAFLRPAEANPVIVRALRDAIELGKQSRRALVILGCELHLPPEISKEVVVVEYGLPDRDGLAAVLKGICAAAGINLDADTAAECVTAAAGMTTAEAETAFSISFREVGTISPEIIHREKTQAVRKGGLLEVVDSAVTPDDIGGLEHLKEYLKEVSGLFGGAAREYGVEPPAGILVVGQPGTGKSLTAQAARAAFGIPELRLEAGRLFGSLVGESERNWRQAFATVQAVAPCILWIDEVDGLFAGGGGASTDGGTTQRVLKAILQDMQLNGKGIFFLFTANDIHHLPDPLIDRLQVWSVDLPTAADREAIWKIHIARRGRDPGAFNLAGLAEITGGFSGRQIEQAWRSAMTLAFNAKREPTMDDCVKAVSRMTPTSKTMQAEIEARRKRLAGKAQPAGRVESAAVPAAAGGRAFD